MHTAKCTHVCEAGALVQVEISDTAKSRDIRELFTCCENNPRSAGKRTDIGQTKQFSRLTRATPATGKVEDPRLWDKLRRARAWSF